ncbi:MAG: ABC transporter permease [Rhodothermales bacterium]|nr:ABC transporter permease [Rhodothermales bacterium]MBO6780984.1 ABC transporter permease [Rhodothermales bacterium]
MLFNYLKTTFRNLWRRKGYTAINVLGLSMGLACCLIIVLFVQDEMSYDQHHEHADRIYRVSQEVTRPGEEEIWAWTGGGLLEDLVPDFPDQVETAARMLPSAGVVVRDRGNGSVVSLREEGFVFLDPQWFDIFTHEFVQGSAETALTDPSSVVLTESAAKRYFGDEDPMGQPLRYGSALDLIVTGVIADPPDNSHIQFEVAASVSGFKRTQDFPVEAQFGSYWWPFSYTYVKLSENADAAALDAALPEFAKRHREEAESYVPRLEALTDLYLYSEARSTNGPTGSIQAVRVFSAIALVVLLLACINFMNLATARSARRAREVGVRKAVGAGRSQLVAQFLGEAVVLSLLSLVVAIGLVEIFLPAFNQIAARSLEVVYLGNGTYWLILLSLVLATGLLSGSYPALYLSKFAPVKVLKGTFAAGKSGNVVVRKGLVVFQFGISVVLIACTLIALAQLRFLQNSNLGFERDQVVRIRLEGANYDLLKNELTATPGVLGVTSASTPPGLGSGSSLPYRSGIDYMSAAQEEDSRMANQQVDYNFVEQMGLNIVAGRDFDPNRPSDRGVWPEDQYFLHIYERAFLINETAAAAMGKTPEEALGTNMRLYAFENGTYYTDLRGTVVGVIEDFHYRSLRNRIEPAAYSLADTDRGHMGGYALVKVEGGDAAETMARLERSFKAVAPTVPFDATFLDQEIQNMYLRESRLSSIVGVFTLLGIVIACLGLIGLATFAAEQRTKEIGVRKVLGASVPGLVGLLAKEFVRLVVVAFVLAAPLAWVVMNRWLENFAYHIEPGVGIFAATGAAALAVALLSVSWQAFQAARANPVESLRYE